MEPINQEHEIDYLSGHPLVSADILELLDQVPDKVFFWLNTIEGKCLLISPSAREVLGYTAEFLHNEGLTFFASIVHPEDYQSTLSEYAKTLVEIKNLVDSHRFSFGKSMEFRIRSGSGKWIWIEINFALMSTSSKEMAGNIFGTIKDISVFRSGHSLTNSSEIQQSELIKDTEEHHPQTDLIEIGLQDEPLPNITTREKEVLYMIAQGYSSKQIADILCISTFTVINHRKHLIAKFNASNTAELIKLASKYFWI